MNSSNKHDPKDRLLGCAAVLRVREEESEVVRGGRVHIAQFASIFPSPRTERAQPGNLVAI